MREIKFRAWDIYSKKMFQADSIFFKGCYSNYRHGFEETEACQIGPGDYGELEIRNSSSIFMQYTGLKDKNGKEIYEGDIVNDGAKVYKKIGFNFGSFTLDLIDGRIDCSLFDCTPSIFIVGNIYENPELLENKK